MKIFKWMVMTIFLITFTQNASAKKSHKDKAQIAYDQGNYETALALWKKTIARYEKRNKGAQCPVYAKAATAALKLNKEEEARDLFGKAIYSASASPEAYVELAHLYRKVNNLTLEIEVLEKYVEKYPSGKEFIPMQERLFATYMESENWQEAMNLWRKLPAVFTDETANKEMLLKANIALENTKASDKLASVILKSDPKNITALDWLAKKYFWLGENRYQAEMKAYNKNKTRGQYAQLLEAFKVVTVNFKKSLGYFRRLYALQPTSDNALFLGNTYARLDNQPRAKYYHNIASKLKKEGK